MTPPLTPPTDPDLHSFIIWAAGIALTTLASVIGVFWRIGVKTLAEIKKRNDATEEELKDTVASLILLTREVGELQGRVSLAAELDSKLNSVHDLLGKVFAKVSE